MGTIKRIKEMFVGKKRKEDGSMVDYNQELQFLDNIPWEAPDDPELQPYLEPVKPYDLSMYDDPKLREFTKWFLRRSKTPKEFATTVWRWKKNNLLWVYEPPRPVWEIVESKEANCMNRATLFVTMCRLCKIPTRYKFFKYYIDWCHGYCFPVEISEQMPINTIIHISVESFIGKDWVDFDDWDDFWYMPCPYDHNAKSNMVIIGQEEMIRCMGTQKDLISEVLYEQFKAGGLTKMICQQMIDPFSEWQRSLSDADYCMTFRQFEGDERAANVARLCLFVALGMPFYGHTRYEVDTWDTEFKFRDVDMPKLKPDNPTEWPMEDQCLPRPADRKLNGQHSQDIRARRRHPNTDIDHMEIVRAKDAEEKTKAGPSV
jgi:hypothetical protein